MTNSYAGPNTEIPAEGYLYEGDESVAPYGHQYLLHAQAEMEPGRVFIFFDDDDSSTSPGYRRMAQIVRFNASGFYPGPAADFGTSPSIKSAGDSMDATYLGNGNVVVGTYLPNLTGMRGYLYHVDDSDQITYRNAVEILFPGKIHMSNLSLAPVGDGTCLLASGTGVMTGQHCIRAKLGVDENGELTLLANDTAMGSSLRPGRYPDVLSGGRILYKGDQGDEYGAPQSTYQLYDANAMTPLATYLVEPNNNNFGMRVPSVPVDGDRVFIAENSQMPGGIPQHRLRLYDLSANTFAYTDLPGTQWPIIVEYYGPSPYVNPNRSPDINVNKWTEAYEHGGLSMLDPSIICWVAPAGGGTYDGNEVNVYFYDWTADVLLGWAIVKGGYINDDPNNYDIQTNSENICWIAPISDGNVLVLMSEYADTPVGPSFNGSIYAAIVGPAAPPIAATPGGDRRRFTA